MKKSIVFVILCSAIAFSISTFGSCNPPDSEENYQIPEDDGPETVYDSVD